MVTIHEGLTLYRTSPSLRYPMNHELVVGRPIQNFPEMFLLHGIHPRSKHYTPISYTSQADVDSLLRNGWAIGKGVQLVDHDLLEEE